MAVSPDLTWQIVRNNHAFLLKGRNIRRPFSTEPCNLKGVNTFRYNGFVRRNVLGIEPASDNKGVVLTYKRSKGQRKPSQSIKRATLKKGLRRSLKSVRNFVRANRYRRDLKGLAVRRTCAILKSQKPRPVKKGAAKK